MVIILLTRSLINEGKVKILRMTISRLLLNVACLYEMHSLLI